VSLSGSSQNGSCPAPTSRLSITVNPEPPIPIITSSRSDNNFCSGGIAVLSVYTDPYSDHQWRRDGINITGATGSSYNATQSGNYTVAVTKYSSCVKISNPLAVTVNPTPTATVTLAGSTSLCTGGSVILNANTGVGLTYQWSNGLIISGATSSSYTASQAGNYSVIVTNSSSCAATSSAVVVTMNGLPTATITPASTTTFCSGGSVVLNANTGTGLTYQWKLNGANIAGATGSTYTASLAGSYTAAVTNTSACTTVSSAVTVIVNPLPVATVAPSGTILLCTGASTTLNATTGSGLTHQWKLNGANISGASASSYTTPAAGSYSVTITNASTCSATSSTTIVTVNSLPSATVTAAGALTFCTGGSVTLNANTGTGLTYQWKKGGTNIGGATTASYSASQPGNYSVTVTNSSACSATSTAVVVTVNPLPIASITPSASATACQGGSVLLSATTGSGFTYQWVKDGSNISGATASNFSASQTGNYQVIVTSNGCSSTSASVAVGQAAPLTVSISGPSSICPGSSSTLSAVINAIPDNTRVNNATVPQYYYLWSTGATTSSIPVSSSGTYSVTVTDSYSGCSRTASFTLITSSKPIISAGGNFCSSTSVTLTSSTASTYRWSNGATTRAITVNNAGTYSVTATTNGCSLTSNPYVLSPCSDPCNSQVASSGSKASYTTVPCLQTAPATLSVYPNQADEDFSLQFSKTLVNDTHFVLHDQFGMVLKKGVLVKNSNEVRIETKELPIETKELPDGLYIIRVFTIEGLSTQKVIVSHGH